jgi:hypothetical protein
VSRFRGFSDRQHSALALLLKADECRARVVTSSGTGRGATGWWVHSGTAAALAKRELLEMQPSRHGGYRIYLTDMGRALARGHAHCAPGDCVSR